MIHVVRTEGEGQHQHHGWGWAAPGAMGGELVIMMSHIPEAPTPLPAAQCPILSPHPQHSALAPLPAGQLLTPIPLPTAQHSAP